jgi:hypothetical protein
MPLSKIDSDSLSAPLTVPAGSAADPAITTTGDSNTGIFFPAADQVATSTGGVQRTVVDASGNVGIGTSSPNRPLSIQRGAGVGAYIDMAGNGNTLGSTSFVIGQGEDDTAYVYNRKNSPMAFATNNTERARIDTSGNFSIKTATNADGNALNVVQTTANTVLGLKCGGTGAINFYNSAGTYVTTVTVSGTTVTYPTSSDYRLKDNIFPMTGALAKVAALKPCTYTWKQDGSEGQGFIAHELQGVIPQAVVGEKDAMREDGSIKPQGIDTSFLVATLTAAIQELKAIVDGQAVLIAAQGAEIAALKGTP